MPLGGPSPERTASFRRQLLLPIAKNDFVGIPLQVTIKNFTGFIKPALLRVKHHQPSVRFFPGGIQADCLQELLFSLDVVSRSLQDAGKTQRRSGALGIEFNGPATELKGMR